MLTLADTTRRQIRALRKRQGITQQGLAERLNQLGAHTGRTAIAKVEAGDREVSLAEAFMFAWALHVAPVHLFVPTDGDEPINIGANLEVSPREVRAWIRGGACGGRPFPFQDPRAYFSLVPPEELPPELAQQEQAR